MSGDGWSPDKQWDLVHGDTKSTTEGTYHTETMKDSNGAFIAKIVGAFDSSPVIIRYIS